jgi:hypothetical protein
MITRRLRTIAALTLAAALGGCSTTEATTQAPADGETALSISNRNPPSTPPYDINVLLFAANRVEGLILFRQPDDGATTIFLETYLARLKPNHDYYLERAAQTLGLGCADAGWLRLGLGTVVTPIHTNWRGFGAATLNRTLPAALVGVSFDIHFRVLDSETGAVVLESKCRQYTVRAV